MVVFILFILGHQIYWESGSDRMLWEDEQQKLDREWYMMDEGQDEQNNVFSNISEEYTKKKEQQLITNSKKRMSAQQRQINKVRTTELIF